MTAPETRCARCGVPESDPDPINGWIHPPDHAYVAPREGGWGVSEIVSVHSRARVNDFLRLHYLGGVPGWKAAGALVSETGLGWDGVVVLSLPVARMGTGLDVTRLCLRRVAPKNSGSRLLGWATRKAVSMGYRTVTSYADPSVGHTGIIYRAANFVDSGRTTGGSWGNRQGRKVRFTGSKLRFVWRKP